MNSTSAADTAGAEGAAGARSPPKKKPSPYRIPKLDAFQESFGPLAAAGWRLSPASSSAAGPAEAAGVSDPLQLEAKRLVQSYHFAGGEYPRLLDMLAQVGQLVQEQDVSQTCGMADAQHHPTIVSGPSCDVADRSEGYTLRVSMLTHTPMPPLGTKMERKLAPGVTGKDLKLAQAIEGLWQQDGKAP